MSEPRAAKPREGPQGPAASERLSASRLTEVGGAKLTLLSRTYCHLCEEMEAALRPFVARHGVALTVLDVDAHPALEARYGERVPVLIAGAPESGVELCHYVLDTDAVDRALARAGAAGA